MRYLLATLLLLIAAPAARAYDFVRTDEGLRTYWRIDTVLIEVPDATADHLGPYYMDMLDDVAAVWEGIGTAPAVEFVPEGTKAQVKLVWVEDWKGDADHLAEARTNFYADNGVKFKGMIKINGKEKWNTGTESPCTDCYDLQSVLVHEVGHILGLDHTEVKGAVMWPTSSKGKTVRAPKPDDIAGILDLYPPPPAAANYSLELSRGCSICPSRRTAQVPLLFVLMSGAILFARRYEKRGKK